MGDDAVSGTRERSVAEIIGKTADGAWPHDGRDITPDAWESMPVGVTLTCPACGQEYNVDEPSTCSVDWRNASPAVDEMLAWLDRNRWSWSAHPHVFEGVRVTLESRDMSRSQQRVMRSAPTLHAALEAAVRAVAEAEGGAG